MQKHQIKHSFKSLDESGWIHRIKFRVKKKTDSILKNQQII